MSLVKHLLLDETFAQGPTREPHLPILPHLPKATETRLQPSHALDDVNASLMFIGTATTVLEWKGIRLMTDPDFLRKGERVQKGPGVSSSKLTNPAIDLYNLPRIDVVLVSNYHEDHFDRVAQACLRRSLPIISTFHTEAHLTSKLEEEAFTAVYALDTYQSMMIHTKPCRLLSVQTPAIKVTAMPGKHVPPHLAASHDDFIQAVPPVTGWMLELGHLAFASAADDAFKCGYRIYITGDTLLVDELQEIPARYAGKNIDLMLIHLGGTTIPEPDQPFLVTMDAFQGLQLMQLIQPDITIPIHYDDYDIFRSPLREFKKAVKDAGLEDKRRHIRLAIVDDSIRSSTSTNSSGPIAGIYQKL
ncbi:hypothetical protein V493_00699 [Pseudogymnoascus sp. VKM F-4281 (FW-2241)]|nr:hypothetical protein V493_00699 [Pseudogymnoascus sp. VKM F-4281 (FW-2241)]